LYKVMICKLFTNLLEYTFILFMLFDGPNRIYACKSIKTTKLSWWRGSVVRASVFDWQTFPLSLTCDHFVGEMSAMGQPTRPIQPSTLSGTGNE